MNIDLIRYVDFKKPEGLNLYQHSCNNPKSKLRLLNRIQTTEIVGVIKSHTDDGNS